MTLSFKVCQSYPRHKGKCWFVSTIDRESSAMGGPMRYWETLVWEADPKTEQRIGDRILYQGEGPRCHTKVVESLLFTGDFPKEEE